MQLQDRDSEISQLRDECKKLLEMHQRQMTAAADAAVELAVKVDEKLRMELESARLTAELSALKQSYTPFQAAEVPYFSSMFTNPVGSTHAVLPARPGTRIPVFALLSF